MSYRKNEIVSYVLNCFELVENILNFTNPSFEIFLSFRLINKTFNNAVKDFLKKKEESYLSGQATFICTGFCWNCSGDKNLKHLMYVQDQHPSRVIVYCNDL